MKESIAGTILMEILPFEFKAKPVVGFVADGEVTGGGADSARLRVTLSVGVVTTLTSRFMGV